MHVSPCYCNPEHKESCSSSAETVVCNIEDPYISNVTVSTSVAEFSNVLLEKACNSSSADRKKTVDLFKVLIDL